MDFLFGARFFCLWRSIFFGASQKFCFGCTFTMNLFTFISLSLCFQMAEIFRFGVLCVPFVHFNFFDATHRFFFLQFSFFFACSSCLISNMVLIFYFLCLSSVKSLKSNSNNFPFIVYFWSYLSYQIWYFIDKNE